MARQGREVIAVADSSKIDAVSPALINVLVKDLSLPPDVDVALQARGITVLKV
jgi:hypothetical protein